ncbi:MAG TPA: phage holin family protein [Puia sp.]|nr:phage holin family protein [Puia sp.]
MAEDFKIIEESVDHIKHYLNTRIAQVKLTTAEKTSEVLSVLMARLMVTAIFSFSLLFASFAAAYALGELLAKTWLGFVIVAAFYLLAGLLIWAFREPLLRIPIMNRLIQRLFTQESPSHETH